MNIFENDIIKLQQVVFRCIETYINTSLSSIDKKRRNDDLRTFLDSCKLSIERGLELGDELVLKWFRLDHSGSKDFLLAKKKNIPAVVLEMVYEEEDSIKIRELLGTRLLKSREDITLDEYMSDGQQDLLNIRDRDFAMPQTLKKSDKLATGYVLLEDPRGIPHDSYNVILHISNGRRGGLRDQEWIVVPRNLPIALRRRRK